MQILGKTKCSKWHNVFLFWWEHLKGLRVETAHAIRLSPQTNVESGLSWRGGRTLELYWIQNMPGDIFRANHNYANFFLTIKWKICVTYKTNRYYYLTTTQTLIAINISVTAANVAEVQINHELSIFTQLAHLQNRTIYGLIKSF